MRRTREQAARAATAAIHRAKRDLVIARQRLAKATRPDAPSVYVEPRYRWAFNALEEHRERLTRIPGVLGLCVGRRLKDGLPTGELCLTVLVAEKLASSALQVRKLQGLPKYIAYRKRRLRIDVLAVGTLERQVVAGTSTGPQDVQNEGTIGAFARELGTNAMVAITAMHVTGISEFPNGQAPPVFAIPSTRRGLPTQVLGSLTFGTMIGVDAAKIRLDDPADAANILPGIGTISGWRPVTYPGDEQASVRMVGALSGLTAGTIVHPAVVMPTIGLDAAILANIPSQEGDSGAALIDAQNHVLGFLVGRATGALYANLRIFSPAQAVLNVLACDID